MLYSIKNYKTPVRDALVGFANRPDVRVVVAERPLGRKHIAMRFGMAHEQ